MTDAPLYSCKKCGGPLVYLGTLGTLRWYRCLLCHAEHATLQNPPTIRRPHPKDVPS